MKATTKDAQQMLPIPSEGWHTLKIADKIKWREKDGEATDQLVFALDVASGSEEGARTFNSFGMGSDGGRKALALMLFYLNVTEKIEQKYSLNGAAEMTEEEWGREYLDPSKKMGQDILNDIIVQIPGKTLDGKIRHRAWSSGGKSGVNADVVRWDFEGQGAKNDDKAEPKTAAPKGAQSTPSTSNW